MSAPIQVDRHNPTALAAALSARTAPDKPNLDELLLEVMIGRVSSLDATLRMRMDEAREISAKNQLLRTLSRVFREVELDGLHNDGKVKNDALALKWVTVPPHHPIREKLTLPKQLNTDGLQKDSFVYKSTKAVAEWLSTDKFKKEEKIPLAYVLPGMGITPPKTANDVKNIIKTLSDQMSQTESQNTQILLQDAIQRSKEVVTVAAGLIKSANERRMTILNKL